MKWMAMAIWLNTQLENLIQLLTYFRFNDQVMTRLCKKENDEIHGNQCRVAQDLFRE